MSRPNHRGRHPSRAVGALFGALIVLVAASKVAAAETPTAEQLDREGTAALDAGDLATACPKLAESQRLEPGMGVLLRLALCYERAGLTASAWKRYYEAEELAHRTGNAELSDLSRRRMAALKPLLSTVILRVHRVDGLQIALDGAPVTPDDWDRPLPVDAGAHEVVAVAPGMQRFTGSVSSPDPDHAAVVDVELVRKREPTRPPDESPSPPDRPGWGWQRTAALSFGTVGIAGFIVGGVAGGLALSTMDSARDQCPGRIHCSPQALALQDRARREATIADVSFVVGGTAAVAGLVLWFLAPSTATHASWQFSPVVFARGGGLTSAALF